MVHEYAYFFMNTFGNQSIHCYFYIASLSWQCSHSRMKSSTAKERTGCKRSRTKALIRPKTSRQKATGLYLSDGERAKGRVKTPLQKDPYKRADPFTGE